MKADFIFPENCTVIQNGNTVTVITETNVLNISVVVNGCQVEEVRGLAIRDKGHEIKMGTS